MSEIVVQCSRAAPVGWLAEHFQLFDTSHWIARLSHSPFSHGDLRLDNGDLLGSSNSKNSPYIAGNPAGVAIRPPDYQKFRLRVDARIEATAEQKAAFEQFCRDQLGKPFDSEALRFRTFLSGDFHDRDWREPSKWYCWEMIACATKHANLLRRPLVIVKNRVTSADWLLMVNHILINVDDFLLFEQRHVGGAIPPIMEVER